MSIVHDKPTEERKSNALRSTNLRDSDQHWNSPNMPAVFFINKKFTCCAERAFLSLPIICLWPNSNKRFNTHHTMRTTTVGDLRNTQKTLLFKIYKKITIYLNKMNLRT